MADEFAQLLSRFPQPLAFAGVFLVVGFLTTRLAFSDRPLGRFLCQLTSFAGFTAMLLIAGVMPYQPTPTMDRTLTFVLISVFKIVWWFAASWLLSGFFQAVLVFKRQPRETRFLQDLVAGLIYIGAILAIVSNVFNMAVTGLLAASGVIAIVLGLALQSTLGDVFSGVVLNLAKPYHPGDWVTIDGGLQGRVIEINWRATQILTPNNDLAIIPNSLIARAKLVNASTPTRAHGATITIRLDPMVLPSRACAVLEMALLNCSQILRLPLPTVEIQTLDAIALDCQVQYFVSAIEDAPKAQNELIDLVFRHCASAGIRLAPPRGSSIALTLRDGPPEPADGPRLLLDHLAIFAPLPKSNGSTWERR